MAKLRKLKDIQALPPWDTAQKVGDAFRSCEAIIIGAVGGITRWHRLREHFAGGADFTSEMVAEQRAAAVDWYAQRWRDHPWSRVVDEAVKDFKAYETIRRAVNFSVAYQRTG